MLSISAIDYPPINSSYPFSTIRNRSDIRGDLAHGCASLGEPLVLAFTILAYTMINMKGLLHTHLSDELLHSFVDLLRRILKLRSYLPCFFHERHFMLRRIYAAFSERIGVDVRTNAQG